MRYRMTALITLCMSLSFMSIGETGKAATTLTVTKTTDTDDGVCDADCSLREAIAAAVSGDTIQFSSLFDTPQTITLAGTELVIDKDLIITGAGADKVTVSGNNQSRVFHIQEFVALSLGGMTITGGNADAGGGILNEGSLSATECHITGNAAGKGGGIGSSSGVVTLRNSTISNNTAANHGGGIWHDNLGGQSLTITNTTISGNTVSSIFGDGGGLFIGRSASGYITNSTITNNLPGGITSFSDGVYVGSSIIAANQNNSVSPDVEGAFSHSNSENFVGNVGYLSDEFPASSNIVGNHIVQADPGLGPLTDNGGPTPTHALLPCSLAIDAGLPLGLSTDQRGTSFYRNRDGNGDGVAVADIGAFEVQTFTPAICNTGPPTIDAADLIIQQGTSARFDIASVADPDGLFTVGILLASSNPSNGVRLSNIGMLSFGIFSADVAASCTASNASFALIVGDGLFQASDTLTVAVTPETTPPVIVLRTDPITLFPNDHKYLTLFMSAFIASASDNCDSSVNLNSAVITQVTSDEPDNAPGNSDGNTINDIVIAPDCKSVQLRAERDGDRDGRVYTIMLRVRDVSGNTTTATRKVTVPLSQNGNPAIEGAPQYTVTSSCP